MIRLASFFIVSFVFLPSAWAQSFPDVEESHSNFEAIEYGFKETIISGYDDGYYRPDRPITRSEFLKILFSARTDLAGEVLQGCFLPEYVFGDVPIDAWFHHYVCMAYRENVVEGYEDGSFRPGNNITAVEALKIVSLEYLPKQIPPLLDAGPWYEAYVRAVVGKNALPLSVVSPSHELTRGEMIEIIWRLRSDNTSLPSHTYDSFVSSSDSSSGFEQRFLDDGLKTNTSLAAIDLGQVIDGGPDKDELPALFDPPFVSASSVEWLNNDSRGILFNDRFYPYSILYWHEVVNDMVDGRNIAVTFCPLCGSAIVYDRIVNGDVYSFGVSGKLWESNLLMYDKETESLWSQVEGRAVVGDMLGKRLSVLSSDVMTFGEAQLSVPSLQVLSQDTGHDFDYRYNPYATYEADDSLWFSVTNRDERFDFKELFVATVFEGQAVAFHRGDLLSVGRGSIQVNGKTLFARVNEDKTIEVYDLQGSVYPHFVTMWFSWSNHNNGFFWRK